MHVLITGEAGLFGSQTTYPLLAQGYLHTVLDTFSRGQRENLADGQQRDFVGSIAATNLAAQGSTGGRLATRPGLRDIPHTTPVFPYRSTTAALLGLMS